MRQLSRNLCAIVLAAFAGAGCSACGLTQRSQTAPPPATPEQRATASPANPDSAILADFNARLDNYVKVQRALAQKTDTQPKESSNAAEITAAQDVLGAAIRNVRKNAKQGEIFTPQIASMFRRLMYPDLRGEEGAETREVIQGEPVEVWLKVNANYPQDQPLATVPGNILASLPQLPKDVEYRFVGKHLLLRDVDANIIVDFIYNAIR